MQLIASKFIDPSKDKYPKNALHIFAENEPAITLNTAMNLTIHTDLYNIKSNDTVPKKYNCFKNRSMTTPQPQ